MFDWNARAFHSSLFFHIIKDPTIKKFAIDCGRTFHFPLTLNLPFVSKIMQAEGIEFVAYGCRKLLNRKMLSDQ